MKADENGCVVSDKLLMFTLRISTA